MKKFFYPIIFFVFCLVFSSCGPWPDDDEDLSTTPITNNPNIVPQHGSGLPMMPGR